MIDQNLSQPDLDVKFLTAQMAMSRTSLYNKIKELTGMEQTIISIVEESTKQSFF